jgi:digeranylgeranylglycerophospholipid reductase
MEKFDYDVIIVGAGPAGCSTAKYINPDGNNLKVLLIDRRKKIGTPVQCGESHPSIQAWEKIMPNNYPLKELFNIPRKTIANEIKYFEIISPKGKHYIYDLNYNEFILNRDIFDQHLSDIAIKKGAELLINTSVKGLKNKHTVVTSDGNISGDIIVGADGPVSIVRKSIGLKAPNNIVPCVTAILKGDFNKDYKSIFIGGHYRDGFGWIFPKGDTANIGFGTENYKNISLIDTFNELIIKNGFTSKDILIKGGGVVPMSGPIPVTVKENVMFVGDSAGMVLPLTGHGIGFAMIAGRECGKTIAEHFIKDEPLSSYEKKWRLLFENILIKSLNRKKIWILLTRNDSMTDFILRTFIRSGIYKQFR